MTTKFEVGDRVRLGGYITIFTVVSILSDDRYYVQD